jgi:hypothetical protein
MILTTEDLFLQGPYLLLTARKTCQETQTWALLCKHCIFPKFETLPLHFIPRHPSPTQHLPRYLRVTSFLFVSCRSLTSSLTPHSAPLLGPLFSRASNPVTATTRPRFTPRPRPQRHASHVPRLGPARAMSRPSARAGTGYLTSLGSGRHGLHVKPPPARRDC